ncbi:CELL GROWTH-REGULATING NUCLEOLAR PROTEIN LYAR [Salix viminalis]|uniref:CELL GROWTH-REGULATING NUCLEOLAR PROTEIN LYAR n=1 Tax=Salix viminalis TaxID=40686 RepID=A0A6N2MRZ0_SALVM|nr:CELL GROWTH-REGULATING NUCLEOLAR PROTEIN LYAR [Salix viminalis]
MEPRIFQKQKPAIRTVNPNKGLKPLCSFSRLLLKRRLIALCSIHQGQREMVWFQCEDCGENLKKPKLPNHFRMCSATKLSCIDCGETFGKQSVQGHTQCITEAEKYGPKGLGKASNGATPKSNKDAKQKPDVDINVGLTERPPWFCSLCNTKATSKQTLLLHADGKKHRAKARAIQAAKQQPKQTEESALDSNAPTKAALMENNHVEEQKLQDTPDADSADTNTEIENGKLPSKRKRKLDASENDGAGNETKDDDANEVGNDKGQVERRKSGDVESQLKKPKHNALKDDKATSSKKEDNKENIKWRKLIKSTLKSNDGVLKIRKLKKLVLKSIQESGIAKVDTELGNILEQKINSSSRFRVDDKYVHLAAKS